MAVIDLEKIFLDHQIDDDRSGGAVRIRCPADLAAFEGHFPGEPVLPGVVQLAAVRLFSSRIAGVELTPVSTGRVKFNGMVKPEEVIDLRVNLERQDDQWVARFRIKRIGDKISSGTIVYKEAAG